MVARGNIVFVPKGTPVVQSEHPADAPPKSLRRDHVALVEYVSEADRTLGCPSVMYEVGMNVRYVPMDAVRVLDAGCHLLRIGQRQIHGGGWGGWAASYYTSGWCACGEEFPKRESAKQVRANHRAHVLAIAQKELS